MNIRLLTYFIVLTAFIISCTGNGGSNDSASNKEAAGDDGVSVKFTGVKSYYSDDRLDREVQYVNGRRNGVTKTYYNSGRLKQTINYSDGRRNDLATWYYEDGKVFRTTPYTNDTIHGTQTQYYRSGRIKAKMSYVEGKRVPDLEEYFDNGKQKIIRAGIEIKTRDEYAERGVYKIFAELDNKSFGVAFYRGEFTDGLFDSKQVDKIPTSGGLGYLELTKAPIDNKGYVGIIAEYTTDYGNKNYIYKKVTVPYRDVN
jgi:hypothetical protein